MDVAALEVGRTYYELTFADVGMTMPGVRPLVYIGKNLFEEEAEPARFYFQDTVSYIVHGAAEAPQSGMADSGVDIVVSPYREGEVADLCELSDLPEKMKAAEERAKALGYPRLQRIPGKWI